MDILHIVLKLIKKFFEKKIRILNVKCQIELLVLVLLAKVLTFYKFVKCLKCPIVKKVNKDVKLIARTGHFIDERGHFIVENTIYRTFY